MAQAAEKEDKPDSGKAPVAVRVEPPPDKPETAPVKVAEAPPPKPAEAAPAKPVEVAPAKAAEAAPPKQAEAAPAKKAEAAPAKKAEAAPAAKKAEAAPEKKAEAPPAKKPEAAPAKKVEAAPAAKKADAAPEKKADAAPVQKADPALAKKAPASPGTPPPLLPAEGDVPQAAAPDAKSVAREIRRARARRLLVRLVLFVLLPTALAGVYYGLVASDQFRSYSRFTIHSADSRPTHSLEMLVGALPGAGGTQDVLAVRDYVLSRDMLQRLDKEHQFIAHYQQPHIDWISRLPADATFEEAYEYYDDKVLTSFDTTSGILTLEVRAFSPQAASKFAQAILAYSEEMVNQLSERERHDRTKYAEDEVKKAEVRLSKGRQALLELQKKHGEFNPLHSATATFEVRTQLEGELAKARAEVMQLKAYMNDDAPQVRAANEKVRAIAAQVAQENRRLVNPKSEKGLNMSLADFEAAMVEKEFAEKAYESTLAALENARSDAARQHRYLATIARPSLPDESTYPRRWLSFFTVFVLSFLLMGILSLLAAAVREHARL